MNEIIKYQPGELIIKEGDTGKGFFVLRFGTLEVLKGNNLIVQIDTPGSIFGEMSDILEKPRTCNVKAVTECEVIYMTLSIEEMIRTRPKFTSELIRNLAERLEKTTEKHASSDESPIWCFEVPLKDIEAA